MGKKLNAAKMKHAYQNNREEFLTDLRENLADGTLRPEDFSLRDCFECLHEHGSELLRMIERGKSGGANLRDLLEASGDAINSGDFASITGQFVFNKTLEGYQYPQALWPMLSDEYSTEFLDGERIPGVGEFGQSAIEVVGEGERFPELGLNEEYTDTVPLQKRGFIASITKEMIIKDRTGLLLMRCANGGKWMSINKDLRVIACATGTGTAANSYNRNNIYTNTYLASGAYINQANVSLVNWKSVETLELLFAAITDPNTGEPVILEATQLLMPLALRRTAQFIQHATSTAFVDNQANASTVRTYGDNPLKKGFYGQAPYEILSSANVSRVTASQTAWFLGDFKRAILYKQAWGLEETQAPPQSAEEFHRDIAQQWKVSECGNAQMIQPRYLARAN